MGVPFAYFDFQMDFSSSQGFFSTQNQTTIVPKLKLDFIRQCVFRGHRSGWRHVLECLRPLHLNSGIGCDGFLESTFLWRFEPGLANRNVVYQEPWVGFLHNPPSIPPWYPEEERFHEPQALLKNPAFVKSLANCKGLFVFSEHLKKHLNTLVDVEVASVFHPTAMPDLSWDPLRFKKNKDKKLLHVGSWLRKFTSFMRVASPYRKVALVNSRHFLEEYCAEEIRHYNSLHQPKISTHNSDIELMDRVSDSSFDKMLAENVVFVDLYDASANNTVVECIVRNTPILINRHPATVEYLGEKYPLFFEDLGEAALLLADPEKVFEAHRYLINSGLKERLHGDRFVESIASSALYRNL